MSEVSSSVVITVPGLTRLPTLTRRKPVLPSNGARMTVSSRRALADVDAAWFAFSVASIRSSCDTDKRLLRVQSRGCV